MPPTTAAGSVQRLPVHRLSRMNFAHRRCKRIEVQRHYVGRFKSGFIEYKAAGVEQASLPVTLQLHWIFFWKPLGKDQNSIDPIR